MGKTIAEKLTEIKNESGISNQKLADLSGVPVGTVNKVLSGSTEKPSFEAVAAMMNAMHRNIDELQDGAHGASESSQEASKNVYNYLNELLISYENQLAEYRDTVKKVERMHKRTFWAMFGLLVLIIIFVCYLCLDASHGNWGIIRYAEQLP